MFTRRGYDKAIPPGRGRTALRLAFVAAIALELFRASSGAAEQNRETEKFSFATVDRLARDLARDAFIPPDEPVMPESLARLSFAEWLALASGRPEGVLRQDRIASFGLRFLPPGYFFSQTLAVNIVFNGISEALPFSADLFPGRAGDADSGIPDPESGFAGFLLDFMASPDAAARAMEPIGLVGASHFAFKGKNARFGIFARPVTINTAEPSGEEHPFFRELWLCRPHPGDGSFVFYALMDSPGATGAFELAATPGTAVVVDVRAVLYKRRPAATLKIGLAPLSGMYLHSETGGAHPGDYRPEVHTTDGLLLTEGDRDWRWIALKNPERLLISSFDLANPRGFGLLQRDGDFDNYQDLENRYDRRTSVWVEPKGDWGAGKIELVEIPNTRENHLNILAYWIADEPPDAPEKTAVQLAYRLYWTSPGGRLHELGAVENTRMMRSPEDGTVTFVVDYESEFLKTLPADTGLSSVVESPPEAPLLDKRLMKNEITGGWRLFLTFRLPEDGVIDSLLSARGKLPPLKFSAYLKKGENLDEALTEKWIYSLGH